MASIDPITSAVNAPLIPALVLPPQTTSQAANAQAAASAQTAAATTTTTQPFDLVIDSLALDSAFDETVLTSTAVQGTGAYSVFMGELFAALAAQQSEAAQSAAQTNGAAATAATAAQPSATTAPSAAAATAEFASNATSLTPNSVLESNVQALASQVQAATGGTDASTTTAAADTPSPLQQSFEQFIASAGAPASANSLPSFLQALANNLHTVPSPLGNLVDSVT